MTSLGETIDQRGIHLPLEEGDIISDILVVAEVLSTDGSRHHKMGVDEHGNWLKDLGLATMAKHELLRD